MQRISENGVWRSKSRPLLNERWESLCGGVGPPSVRLTLGEAWQRQLFIRGGGGGGGGCEDLSRAFYQHRLHACSRGQREEEEKVSVK